MMTSASQTATQTEADSPVLDIRGLNVGFRARTGEVRVVRDVDLAVAPGEVIGLVGESGSGKSMLARAVLGILPQQMRIIEGSVAFAGRDLRALSADALRRLRGDRMAFVPQEPMTSLNPGLRIGRQLTEVLDVHRPDLQRAEKNDLAVQMLDLVGVRYARERLSQYPHQLSGGLRQRVAIAMALICQRVELLVADEPTTALDVTIQAQILDLFVRLQQQRGMAMLLITHDLGVVAQTAHRVAVMYAGEIIEVAPVEALFHAPQHPYTHGLLASLPAIGRAARKSDLPSIAGSVPSPTAARPGCAFANRCAWRDDGACLSVPPRLETVDPAGPNARMVRCHHWKRLADTLRRSAETA